MDFKLYGYRLIVLIIICLINLSTLFITGIKKKKIDNLNMKKRDDQNFTILKENFFVIDSNNLEQIESHMYGFTVTEKGIFTDNYYKLIGEYKDPEPQGIYIMIRKIRNRIIIKQDYCGSFGLYLYENKNTKYFALSNSFLLLQNYLIGKQNLTFNKDFADNLIISELCTFSLDETLINEIYQIPSNSKLIINIKNKSFKINYINYEENTVPLESEEGIQIIDKWVDKWTYILRSLKNKIDTNSFDLSGGFDSRTLLPILLQSGINMNEILIYSYKNYEHGHDEDFIIANNISSKFGFKLNHINLDDNFTKFSLKDTIDGTLYSKLGFHKEFYFKNKFYTKPRFAFRGGGGESLRGFPGEPITKFSDRNSLKNITNHKKEFFNSSKIIFNRSVSLLKQENTFNNEYEISSSLYSKIMARNHFGKESVEAFIANIYFLEPLLDPDIKRIKYDIKNKLPHDLIAYIYIRFTKELINFPFQGNRHLNKESIRKAEYLNNKLKPYKPKSNYNENFYIDIKRSVPSKNISDNRNHYEYLKQIFNSSQFIDLINKKYDIEVYNWAKHYTKISNYIPLRHQYGLLAVAITLQNLQLNEKRLNNSEDKIESNFKKLFIY